MNSAFYLLLHSPDFSMIRGKMVHRPCNLLHIRSLWLCTCNSWKIVKPMSQESPLTFGIQYPLQGRNSSASNFSILHLTQSTLVNLVENGIPRCGADGSLSTGRLPPCRYRRRFPRQISRPQQARKWGLRYSVACREHYHRSICIPQDNRRRSVHKRIRARCGVPYQGESDNRRLSW